jgi:hypothetical protein
VTNPKLDEPDGEKPPYNSDPMDQPAPEQNIFAWGRVVERFVQEHPEPAFTWPEIQTAARVERDSRLREFAFQKNFQMVDWFLDNPQENIPDDLLALTQAYTRDDHEVEE